MKHKKYEEVTYQQDKTLKEIKTDFIILIIAITMLLILLLWACIKGIKLGIEYTELKEEKETLEQVVETKNSMISDLEENLKDLFVENQELKFGGIE